MARKKRETGTGKTKPPAESVDDRKIVSSRRFPVGPLQAWSSLGWTTTENFRAARNCLKNAWPVDDSLISANPSIRAAYVLYFGGLSLTEWGQCPEPLVCLVSHDSRSYWVQAMSAALSVVALARQTGTREWRPMEIMLAECLGFRPAA